VTGQRTSRLLIDWHGDVLCVGDKPFLHVEQGNVWPPMFRVALPSGWRSDLLNRTRAKDLAVLLARSGSKCLPGPQRRPVVSESMPAAL